MRNRSLALLIVLAVSTSVFGADLERGRRDDRGSVERVIRVIKKFFGITSNSDAFTLPRP
jgi:hypothetical protein